MPKDDGMISRSSRKCWNKLQHFKPWFKAAKCGEKCNYDLVAIDWKFTAIPCCMEPASQTKYTITSN